MTDPTTGPASVAGGPAPVPVPEPAPIELPERAPLDPLSAATLAVMDVLDKASASAQSADMLVLDPGALARAALEAAAALDVTNLPRVPRWDGEPRTIGGAQNRVDGEMSLPDPEIAVDVVGTAVVFEIKSAVLAPAAVQASDDSRLTQFDDLIDDARVPPADARTWALAVLAACDAAEQAGPYIVPDPLPEGL